MGHKIRDSYAGTARGKVLLCKRIEEKKNDADNDAHNGQCPGSTGIFRRAVIISGGIAGFGLAGIGHGNNTENRDKKAGDDRQNHMVVDRRKAALTVGITARRIGTGGIGPLRRGLIGGLVSRSRIRGLIGSLVRGLTRGLLIRGLRGGAVGIGVTRLLGVCVFMYSKVSSAVCAKTHAVVVLAAAFRTKHFQHLYHKVVN